MKPIHLPKTASLLQQIEHFLGHQSTPNLSIDALIEDIIHYYETIIGCMPGNVYWLDRDGVAVGCNKNVLEPPCQVLPALRRLLKMK